MPADPPASLAMSGGQKLAAHPPPPPLEREKGEVRLERVTEEGSIFLLKAFVPKDVYCTFLFYRHWLGVRITRLEPLYTFAKNILSYRYTPS